MVRNRTREEYIMKTTRPAIIYNMLEGYNPITNLIGTGDPNVHYIDGQWHMFLGGFQRNFKNNIFCATLSKGHSLGDALKWHINTDPSNPKKALSLVPQPPKGGWDSYGLHEPNYVEGKNPDGSPCYRIYYTGRGSKNEHGKGTSFAIGFIEKTADGWRRHPSPIITGDERNLSVLGPKVIHDEGKWKMWYRATPYETIKGKYPKTEIYYSESTDGVSGWSKPTVFFAREDEVSHAFVAKINDGYHMLTTASPNQCHEKPSPEQRLRLFSTTKASGNRNDWTEDAAHLLDADGGADWYANGFFGASMCQDETAAYYVFFSGVHLHINWFVYAIKRLVRFKKPPFPAPFYFTIGWFKVEP